MQRLQQQLQEYSREQQGQQQGNLMFPGMNQMQQQQQQNQFSSNQNQQQWMAQQQGGFGDQQGNLGNNALALMQQQQQQNAANQMSGISGANNNALMNFGMGGQSGGQSMSSGAAASMDASSASSAQLAGFLGMGNLGAGGAGGNSGKGGGLDNSNIQAFLQQQQQQQSGNLGGLGNVGGMGNQFQQQQQMQQMQQMNQQNAGAGLGSGMMGGNDGGGNQSAQQMLLQQQLAKLQRQISQGQQQQQQQLGLGGMSNNGMDPPSSRNSSDANSLLQGQQQLLQQMRQQRGGQQNNQRGQQGLNRNSSTGQQQMGQQGNPQLGRGTSGGLNQFNQGGGSGNNNRIGNRNSATGLPQLSQRGSGANLQQLSQGRNSFNASQRGSTTKLRQMGQSALARLHQMTGNDRGSSSNLQRNTSSNLLNRNSSKTNMNRDQSGSNLLNSSTNNMNRELSGTSLSSAAGLGNQGNSSAGQNWMAPLPASGSGQNQMGSLGLQGQGLNAMGLQNQSLQNQALQNQLLQQNQNLNSQSLQMGNQNLQDQALQNQTLQNQRMSFNLQQGLSNSGSQGGSGNSNLSQQELLLQQQRQLLQNQGLSQNMFDAQSKGQDSLMMGQQNLSQNFQNQMGGMNSQGNNFNNLGGNANDMSGNSSGNNDSGNQSGGRSSGMNFNTGMGGGGDGNAEGSSSGNQKSFLDGSFAGGWQSNADLPDRRRIIFSILEVIKQMRPGTNKISQKLPHMAKSLEEHLYRSAQTKEEYLDLSTLKKRLQMIAHGLELHRLNPGQSGQQGDGKGGNASNQQQQQQQLQQQQQQLQQQQQQQQQLQQQQLLQLQNQQNFGNQQGNQQNNPQLNQLLNQQLNQQLGQSGNSSSGNAASGNSEMFGANAAGGGQGNMGMQGSDASNYEDQIAAQKKKVIRQQQQRLLLLRHASKCDVGPSCNTKFCAAMVTLWKHMKKCRDKNCTTSHCLSSRCVLNHYRICKSQGRTSTCEVCGPVMEQIKRQETEEDPSDPLTKDQEIPLVESQTSMGGNSGSGIGNGAIDVPSANNALSNTNAIADATGSGSNGKANGNGSGSGDGNGEGDQQQLQQLQAAQMKLQNQLQVLKQLQRQQDHLLQQQRHLQEQQSHIKDPHTQQGQQLQQQQALLQQLQQRCQQQQILLQQQLTVQSNAINSAQGQSGQGQGQGAGAGAPDQSLSGSDTGSVNSANASKRRRSVSKGKTYSYKSRGKCKQLRPIENDDKPTDKVMSSDGKDDSMGLSKKRGPNAMKSDNDGEPLQKALKLDGSSGNFKVEQQGDLDLNVSVISSMQPEMINMHLNSLEKVDQASPASVISKCLPLVQGLLDDPFGWVFKDPVDPEALGLPDYFEVVKKPMHLELVKEKLENGLYTSMETFKNETKLVFENSILYNGETSEVGQLALNMLSTFAEKYDAVLKDDSGETESPKDTCTLCDSQYRRFQPQFLTCSGKSCGMQQIGENDLYFADSKKQNMWCDVCFTSLPDEEPILLNDGSIVRKEDIQSFKNNVIPEEAWIQCDECESWVHQICALFNGKKSSMVGKYTCPKCHLKAMSEGKAEKGSFSKGASELPECGLSSSIEKGLHDSLQMAYQENARELGVDVSEVKKAEGLCVRVLSNIEKRQVIFDEMRQLYAKKGYPSEILMKSKCIAMFQKLHGVDVLLFAMYVNEYDERCPSPNRKRVYISSIDSVKYFEPREFRTIAYQSVLVEYLRYAKSKGFHTAHIWSFPPSPGTEFIFHGRPPAQIAPSEDKLQEWFQKTLQRAKAQGIVLEKTSLFDEYFDGSRQLTDIPYFEGDYIPGEIENIFKLMKSQSDDLMQEEISEDNIMLSLAQNISKIKDNFVVVHLRSRSYAAAVERGEDVSHWKDSEDTDKNSKGNDASGGKSGDDPLSLDVLNSPDGKGAGSHDKNSDKKGPGDKKSSEDGKTKDSVKDSGEEIDLMKISALPDDETDDLADKKNDLSASDLSKGDNAVHHDDDDDDPLKRDFGDVDSLGAPSHVDGDEAVENEVFESRQQFLSYCQSNQIQFNELRRAKHSTMVLLFLLHNPVTLFTHDDKDQAFEPLEVPEEYNRDVKAHVELVEHASLCPGQPNCARQDCMKAKAIFDHLKSCDVKVKKECKVCTRLLSLVSVHARLCTAGGSCPVPFCDRYQLRNKRIALMHYVWDDRRRQAQNFLCGAGMMGS